MAGAKKRASGATQPESARKAGQVLLRLAAADRENLEVLAERWGVTRSEAAARAFAEALERG